MAFVDYYKVLGVSKDIPQKDVKKAYLKRAKQFHPDLHPDDPKAKAKFQALNEAYDVIGDAEKRAKYDQYGEKWKEIEGFQGQSGGNPFEGFDFGKGGGFSDFFKDLFGSRGGGSPFDGFNEPPLDMEASVRINLYTALLGGEIIVQVPNGKKIKLKVKPGTQPDAKVRLKGHGRRGNNGAVGDLIITYHVDLPTNLSERQKELLKEMKRA